MIRDVEEQMADIEHRMKQPRVRKQRIVTREDAGAHEQHTHLVIRPSGILPNGGVLGHGEGI